MSDSDNDFSDKLGDLDDLQIWQAQILLYTGLVAGVIWALAGYYLLRPAVFLSAFFVGSTVTFTVLDDSLKEDVDNRNWIVFGTAGAIGLLAGLIGLKIVKFGIFIVGAAIGVMGAIGIYTLGLYRVWDDAEEQKTLYTCFAVMGLLTGLLALWKDRPIIIVATASSGSFLAGWCISGIVDDGSWPSTHALANGAETKTPEIYYYAAGIVGASILATIFQFRLTAKNVNHKEKNGAYQRYGYNEY